MSVFSIASLTPLLAPHRYWTHDLKTPWFMAFVLLAFLVYLDLGYFDTLASFTDKLLSAIRENFIYVMAAVLGDYTHLVLDSKFFRNKSGHH